MWVIRGGERDELVDLFVEQGVIGIAFPDVPDAEILTRSEIRRFLGQQSTAALDRDENVVSAFVREVQVSSSVLLLDASRAEVVTGTVTGSYEFHGDLPADDVRHRRSVDWLARHAIADLPAAVQDVARQKLTLEQRRDAEWSAYLTQIREQEIGRDPKDRPVRTVAAAAKRAPRASRAAATPRVTKPVIATRTCPSCFLQKHPDQFRGEYCVDCAE